jgi:CubicO group peptidase (beta-lactamase class C family)
VGKYLPDFPVEGDKVITLRHCLSHTTGFEGHGNWGGMNNPWLDNVLANGLELAAPGEVAVYNGMGFDLAGKVMEIVSGKSIFRLFHENFFGPLGQDDPTIVDLGYGIDCTAMDLARVGQLMMNRGAYGETEFFSPETFAQLTPRNYEEAFPLIKKIQGHFLLKGYGLGIQNMPDPHPEAGKNGVAPDQTILSDSTIAHGSASSTILRVDRDNELVVVVTRFTHGKDINTHRSRFLMAVAESLD